MEARELRHPSRAGNRAADSTEPQSFEKDRVQNVIFR